MTNLPQALAHETLANEVYQYEFAYIALQSESYQLSDETTEVIFIVLSRQISHKQYPVRNSTALL